MQVLGVLSTQCQSSLGNWSTTVKMQLLARQSAGVGKVTRGRAAKAFVPARQAVAAVFGKASTETSCSPAHAPAVTLNKRQLLQLAAAVCLLPTGTAHAAEGAGFDLFRTLIRPDDLTPEQAVVILMDARSVLREIAGLAATPQDSRERFEARKLWPGFAKRLRDVGPAGPIVAGLVTGTGKEETLSEYYGGKSNEPGVTDAVYLGLGKVLTISGRTIRPEAQASPDAAKEAQQAIEDLLDKVPKDVYDKAQEFRVVRAQKLKAIA